MGRGEYRDKYKGVDPCTNHRRRCLTLHKRRREMHKGVHHITVLGVLPYTSGGVMCIGLQTVLDVSKGGVLPCTSVAVICTRM